MASEIASGSGPEFPMQVVQPYPTRSNPSSTSGSSRPERSRYSVTTFDPGASEVLTHGFWARPRSTAFFASRPAPSITDGFDVFVQLVIAAITTEPWSSSNSVPSSRVTAAASQGGSATAVWWRWPGPPDRPEAATTEGGSLAGKDSA